ncbi:MULTISPECIES: trypsin-like serine protease [unclassified Streptomyces]|uniref:trypsin-like serine protease n=1 Tax=unclassified Streptomyces TaxID=2593676 RepID=UPI0011651F5C|nr:MULTISPECIES: trypsin-like serine protease [unclassified Streptomyces]NMI61009.1 trypsin-like serine protease [Streptomyces sp. RLA2-12]QDN60123.1 trypsin-like serine protease [Streptomyces sp. S1D4-20]QDN70177.1 trypsin-like serine protease [Streptomyces sp. S1D4-14]QDO52630.1 trypsin-like serine protease [Streptomyces sp. RLB3-5]QDO62873.1 trypsin-like serine protease [Streptomyces sp. RLB1-8]
MSGRGRHRRRIRIAVPVAAAALAAAVGGALLMSSANAATAQPAPLAKTSGTSPSLATLEKRIGGAMASDGAAGRPTRKSSPSASASTGTGTGTSTGTTGTGSGKTATTGTSTGTSANTSGASVDPKIIGGTTTTITTAPWMAQLWYLDDKGTSNTSDDFGFFCGGSVVSPTKILTAAHCVKDEHGKSYDWKAHGAVVTGTSQLPSAGGTDLHGGTATSVLRQWNHPSYNPSTIDNDIAVLTLDGPVKAKPIRMTTSGDTASYASGTKATLYGWGRTSSATQDISGTLKTATLPIKSDATCGGYYKAEFIKGHMVCAGNPATGSDTGTTSACNGDSGGPLIVGGRIVGVVSWGVVDCVQKGAYSVFTKVSTYVGAAYPRVDDTNLSGDHKADLFVRNSSTKTLYEKDSSGTSFGARQSWGAWSTSNVVLQTDLDRDGYQDVVERRTSNGDIHWWHYLPSTGKWADTKLFSDWRTRTRVVAPGDVTGDALPDLLSVDSGGVLWIYPGKGNGTFSARVKVSSGWNQYNSLRAHGDFTGDGKADLIARSNTGSYVYLFKGTGNAGPGAFSSRIKVRTWAGYNAFDAVGDVTGDGKADFLARTPAGTLYLYPGTGKATSEIFATAIKIGTDFKQYDIFG